MSKKREHVVQLVMRRADVEHKQAELARELRSIDAELDRLLVDDGNDTPTPKTSDPEIKVITAIGTLTEKILALLNDNAGRSFTPAEVADALAERWRIKSVRPTLYRLYEEDEIDRPKEGEYRSKQSPPDAASGNGASH
jgi:hypothetical protein